MIYSGAETKKKHSMKYKKSSPYALQDEGAHARKKTIYVKVVTHCICATRIRSAQSEATDLLKQTKFDCETLVSGSKVVYPVGDKKERICLKTSTSQQDICVRKITSSEGKKRLTLIRKSLWTIYPQNFEEKKRTQRPRIKSPSLLWAKISVDVSAGF